MNAHHCLAALRPLVLLLAVTCGPGLAQAKDPNGPPVVDVNVVNPVEATVTGQVDANVTNTVDTTVSNTVNTHIVNVVPFDSVRGLGAASGLSPPGSLTFVDLAPGRLHALNVSVAAPPGADSYCWVRVALVLNPGAAQPDERSLAAVVARDGSSTAVANDYTTPIEVLFDPTAGETLYLRANVTGQVAAGQTCMLSMGGVYEEDAG